MYKIVKSECLADKIYLMDVEAPRIARACQPGEFVIVKMDEVGERIPLTICDYGPDNHSIPDCGSIHRAHGRTEGRGQLCRFRRSAGTAFRIREG